MREQIKAILRDSLLVDVSDHEQDLITEGLLDSARLTELFALLENVFGDEVGVEDLVLDNFRSVERIAAWLGTKDAGA